MEVSRIICFIIALILCLIGIIVSFKRKKTKNALYYSALIEFVAHFILLLPYEYMLTPNSGARGAESFIETLLISLTKYSGEGYDRFLIESSEPSVAMFNSCYNILLALTNILMIVFAADIILHLIEGPYQEFKLFRRRSGKVYLFSECNAKTLAIAKSIKEKSTKKIALVFATSEEEISDIKKVTIKRLDAIHLNLKVSDVYSHLNGKSSEIEVFLFDEQEASNLQEMTDICSGSPAKNNTRLFVEVNETPWSLYDDYITDLAKDNPEVTINLVRTEENFVYNLLLDESMFENAVTVDKVKKIRLLIVGYNYRNVEFLKAILHLGQMPGYELNVVLIEEEDHRKVINQKIPELFACGGGYGDAIYTFKHVTGIDFDSVDFDNLISEHYSGFTYAFVNIEDDIACLNVAMRINTLKNRAVKSSDYKIIASIENRSLCNEEKLNVNLVKNMKIVGDIEEIYNHEFITMSAIENATKEIHKNRYKDKKTWKEYCNKEYNRHSVYARTLSFAYKVKIIDENDNTAGKYNITSDNFEWKVYEHMRWNMYTRTLGYIKAPDDYPRNEDGEISGNVRKALKIHECLIPFNQLSRKEQNKDSLELNEDIVKALKSCFKD